MFFMLLVCSLCANFAAHCSKFALLHVFCTAEKRWPLGKPAPLPISATSTWFFALKMFLRAYSNFSKPIFSLKTPKIRIYDRFIENQKLAPCFLLPTVHVIVILFNSVRSHRTSLLNLTKIATP